MRIGHISSAENVPIEPEVVQTLIDVSGGDLRRSITYLQSASRLSASTDPPSKVTSADIQEIAGVVPDKVVNNFARVLGVDIPSDEMDVPEGRRRQGFEEVRAQVKQIIREGYSASQILSQVSHLKYGSIVSF